MKITDVDSDARKVLEENMQTQVTRLDLGCGNNVKEGFQGIDISINTAASLICDLEQFPWYVKKVVRDNNGILINLERSNIIESNSVAEIYCSHYVEHTSEIILFMEEIYRILIPSGVVTFLAPYYSSIRAMQDPTHKQFISEHTFLYYNKKWREINKLEHYGINCNFNILSTKFIYDATFNTRSDQAKEWAKKHCINVINDIEVILQTVKEKE